MLTAFGFLTADHYTPFQAGVLALRDRSTELFFGTLDKSSGHHARISYRDYAISPTRFHWQTQPPPRRRPRPAAVTWRAATTGGRSSSSCGRERGSRTGRAGRCTSPTRPRT
jgi:hypothetical protein